MKEKHGVFNYSCSNFISSKKRTTFGLKKESTHQLDGCFQNEFKHLD